MDKTNLFFWSLPISPWASFATWLHLEAPPRNIVKINKYLLSNIELVLTHTLSKLGVLGIAEKLSVPFVTLCNNNNNNNNKNNKNNNNNKFKFTA